MSWASRRRTLYGLGVVLFLVVLIGGPVAFGILTDYPTCTDGKRNGGETGIDRGGPCPVLDAASLSPAAIVWARSFSVRSGAYNAVAYIQNPNAGAGVRSVAYTFGLYDERNVIVAERSGVTFLMPGATTPVFEGAIDTGNRTVAHTFFEFTQSLTWERLENTAGKISIGNRTVTEGSSPRISAVVTNTTVSDMRNLEFVAVVSDSNGNAFAASQTVVALLPAGKSASITFTWPDPFPKPIGSIDITALAAPSEPRTR